MLALVLKYQVVIVAALTPLILFVVRDRLPKLKEKLGSRWVWVSVALAMVLNAVGVALSPDDLMVASNDVIQGLIMGVIAGLAGSKGRDLVLGKVVCDKPKE